jgi:hypothetical protein
VCRDTGDVDGELGEEVVNDCGNGGWRFHRVGEKIYVLMFWVCYGCAFRCMELSMYVLQ